MGELRFRIHETEQVMRQLFYRERAILLVFSHGSLRPKICCILRTCAILLLLEKMEKQETLERQTSGITIRPLWRPVNWQRKGAQMEHQYPAQDALARKIESLIDGVVESVDEEEFEKRERKANEVVENVRARVSRQEKA